MKKKKEKQITDFNVQILYIKYVSKELILLVPGTFESILLEDRKSFKRQKHGL